MRPQRLLECASLLCSDTSFVPVAVCRHLQQILDACAASSDCYISYDWDNRLKYAFIFHFFGLLWTNQFIVGLSSVVIAGAVANYYWSRGDTKRWALTGAAAVLLVPSQGSVPGPWLARLAAELASSCWGVDNIVLC